LARDAPFAGGKARSCIRERDERQRAGPGLGRGARYCARPGGRGARLGFAVLLGVGFAVLVMLFVLASRHAFGGNSDDATLVLEGQSMSSGHLALQGWALSFDSFWTLDVPFYAVAVGLLGVGQDLFNVVPAFIAALVVVTGVWMIRMGRRDLASLIGASAVIALLALPGPDSPTSSFRQAGTSPRRCAACWPSSESRGRPADGGWPSRPC